LVYPADVVATRLLAHVQHCVFNASVVAVEQCTDGICVHRRPPGAGASPMTERFDHVVLATQANQPLAL